jgi:hypothetical protein
MEGMINVVIDNVTYPLPTSWSEVTVSQYRSIIAAGEKLDTVMLLSILTGIGYEVLNNLDCSQFDSDVVPELTWIGEPFDPFKLKRAKVLRIGDRKVEPIIFPNKERLGQKLLMQQIVNEAIVSGADHASLITPVVACYYAPYLHRQNKYEEAHVESVKKLVDAMPLVEAYPEANFFLSGYVRYSKTKQKS